MVAYRRFQRFDYIIKGRNCDWFQSIPVSACTTKQANGSSFLLPSSRASRSFCASRKMSRSPRLAHEAPVMQAIPVWSNECSSFDITIENGFFSFHTILNNKTCKQKRFHGWCDMEERILGTRGQSSGSVQVLYITTRFSGCLKPGAICPVFS